MTTVWAVAPLTWRTVIGKVTVLPEREPVFVMLMSVVTGGGGAV